ncbi:MAG: patatin-like phospholipase family protein [Anaerolineae bacterium]
MQPFRRHVAIAIDGGGIRGVMVARALAMLEDHLGASCHDIFRLAAGTSTGSIISAGIGVGLDANRLHALYCELGTSVFRKSWRTALWPLSRYRYPHGPLETHLREYFRDTTMGDIWDARPATDLVITLFDLVAEKTCFVKPWKSEYSDWPVIATVLASCSVPTFFPVVKGGYVDGGVGSFANPCYLAAYEACFCLGWNPSETTLISLGTGRSPGGLRPGQAERFYAWDWIGPVLGAFLKSADDQQVHLVSTFFDQLDFRRFQVDMREPIEMDAADKIRELSVYGEELGREILNDQVDPAMHVRPGRVLREI